MRQSNGKIFLLYLSHVDEKVRKTLKNKKNQCIALIVLNTTDHIINYETRE